MIFKKLFSFHSKDRMIYNLLHGIRLTSSEMMGNMDKSNLPIVKDSKTTEVISSSVMPAVTITKSKDIKLNRFLLAGSLLAITSSIVLITLTQFIFLSILFGIAGAILLVSRQLVKKSLSLTTIISQPQLASVIHQLELVKKDVSKAKFLEFVEREGTELADQASLLLQQYKSIKTLLSQKFEVHEITYSRYLEGVEATCMAIAEILTHTKSSLENLSLTGKRKDQHWQNQHSQVLSEMKSINHALTGLVELFNSINQITTKEKHRDALEHTMQQLSELSKRAQIYSKK